MVDSKSRKRKLDISEENSDAKLSSPSNLSDGDYIAPKPHRSNRKSTIEIKRGNKKLLSDKELLINRYLLYMDLIGDKFGILDCLAIALFACAE